MRFRSAKKPSAYPPGAFHAIRASALISSVIVASIMLYFMYHLRHDGFKLPWTFLVLTATSLLTLVNFVFTSLISCCNHGMPPLLSLIFNSLLFLLWTVSLGLLGWSMSGTLMTSCNTATWGTSTGVMVCRIYKVLFTFTVLAFVLHLAAIVLDVIARRRQRSLGDYDAMYSDAMLGDVKLADQRGSMASSTNMNDPATDAYNAFGTTRPQPKIDPVPPPSYMGRYHDGEAHDYYETAPTRGGRGGGSVWSDSQTGTGYSGTTLRMDNFTTYSHPPEQTRYDPADYRY
ncbi:hypothetical protein M432DRAFT_443595 [Thermoascus aurantiacus ATCC 26904]